MVSWYIIGANLGTKLFSFLFSLTDTFKKKKINIAINCSMGEKKYTVINVDRKIYEYL